MNDEMNICKNCNEAINSNYCPYCGVSSKVKRFDFKYLFDEVEHGLFHFEHGFVFTIKGMFKNPSLLIKKYIEGERFHAYKPIRFVILCSIIYSIIRHYYNNFTGFKPVLETEHYFARWLLDHYNYLNLFGIFFIAFYLSNFFKKYNFNYLETIIILAFIDGILLLVSSLELLLKLTGNWLKVGYIFDLIVILTGFFPHFYVLWVLSNIYNEKVTKIIGKVIGAYMLGLLTFMLIAYIIDFSVDYFRT